MRREELMEVGGAIAAKNEGDKGNIPPERAPFLSPPPVKGNDKGSFKAMDPVHVLLPPAALKHFIERQTVCFNRNCESEEFSLEVQTQQHGLATELHVKCKCCKGSTSIAPPMMPPIIKDKEEPPNNVGTWEFDWEDKFNNFVLARFHRHDINYHAGLLMQKLGKGLRGLGMTMAFIGIAAGTGSDKKWNVMMTKLGELEHAICKKIIDENSEEELRVTNLVADEMLTKWLESNEGNDATQVQEDAKLDQFLHKQSNKIGMYMSANGAWQKRQIGRSGGSSKTGHNFGFGGYTHKIISVQLHSQSCSLCETHEKKNPPAVPPAHRCPQNFPTNVSSKAMELQGTVQHCIDISNSRHSCYAATLITDNDSTTTPNCDYSKHGKCELQHPDSLVNGKIPSTQKCALRWPTDNSNKHNRLKSTLKNYP